MGSPHSTGGNSMMNSCSACRQDLRLDQRRISLSAVVAFLTLVIAGARNNAFGASEAASSPSSQTLVNAAHDARQPFPTTAPDLQQVTPGAGTSAPKDIGHVQASTTASRATPAAAQPASLDVNTYDAARGEKLYAANCSACHQASGEGVPSAFPPLKGSPVVNRDDATKHMHVVLDGLQGARVGGVVYGNAMPAFGETLGDADIADIVDYVRSSWGNHGKPVTAAQVAAERATAR